MSERKQYIYFMHRIDPDSMPSGEAGEAHWNRLLQAMEDGLLLLAGRPQDGKGPGIVIFEAESDEAAQRFADEEPFVASGFVTASLHPFKAALMRGVE